jgi:hypothetical protein
VSCWARQLNNCLGQIGITLHPNEEVDEDAVYGRADLQWMQAVTPTLLDGDVRDIPDDVHDGFRVHTYLQWFSGDNDVRSKFWYHVNQMSHIQVPSLFRMGCHWLNVTTCRVGGEYVPRSKRECMWCGIGEREDEAHILSCPLYDELRLQCGLRMSTCVNA